MSFQALGSIFAQLAGHADEANAALRRIESTVSGSASALNEARAELAALEAEQKRFEDGARGNTGYQAAQAQLDRLKAMLAAVEKLTGEAAEAEEKRLRAAVDEQEALMDSMEERYRATRDRLNAREKELRRRIEGLEDQLESDRDGETEEAERPRRRGFAGVMASVSETTTAVREGAEDITRRIVEAEDAATRLRNLVTQLTSPDTDLYDFGGKGLEDFVTGQRDLIEQIEGTAFGGHLDAYAKAFIKLRAGDTSGAETRMLQQQMRDAMKMIRELTGRAGRVFNFGQFREELLEALGIGSERRRGPITGTAGRPQSPSSSSTSMSVMRWSGMFR